jgi:hypothetical protein
MTPEERFQFDLEGYIVIKDVLTEAELSEMNSQAEIAFPLGDHDPGNRRDSPVSQWGPLFQALIDHPAITPYLDELLGPKFRIDHDYCIFMRKGGAGGNLHGGDTDRSPDHWYRYRDGVMRNGLSVVTFFLSDAGPGDGGFTCIPGSHKSNLVTSLPSDVRTFQRDTHYVVQPEANAGDALIFTEALIHGTRPWTADHERRTLLYKYSPGHSSWSQSYYNPDNYENPTEQQRRILAPPSVGRRPDSLESAD